MCNDGWRKTTIGEQVQLQRGFDITKKQQRAGRVPVVSSGGVSSFHDTAMAVAPGVVLGRKGSLGTVFFMEEDYWPHDTTLWVREFNGNDARFVFYFFKNLDVMHLDVGSANPTLNRNHVHPIGIEWPPLPEQRRIAAILGALDDKIELNRKMNKTLEEMAQAVFKSWFINFDGHDDLVESEVGLVPRGWEVTSVDALVEFNPSVPLKKNTIAVYADMKALPTSGPTVLEWSSRAYSGGARFMQHDTLFARITPCLENGKCALVDFLEREEVGFGSTEFIVLRPRHGVPRAWPYCLARHDSFRAHAIANMTGSSGRQRASVSALANFVMAIPRADVLIRFGAVTDVLFKRITAQSLEMTTLIGLRDTLLPRLISGEIRVPEAEALLEGSL